MSASNKIIPTSRQKSIFFLHLVIFIVVNAILWIVRARQMEAEHRWVYPTAAWITAAWGLAIIGHMCALWTSYSDPGMEDYERQRNRG